MLDITVFWQLCIYSLLVSVLFLTAIFFIARNRDRYDLIDVCWGLAIIAITAVCYTGQQHPRFFSVQTLVGALVLIWGMRLSLHIYTRWNTSSHEDARYTALRQHYEQKKTGVAVNMYLRVYLLQAALAAIVALPVIICFSAGQTPGLQTAIGAAIWVIGFFFEVVGDAQLARFVSNPKNKGTLLTTGLWRYTRHPNYFGELTQWWGVFVIVFTSATWMISGIGPAVLTVLIVWISGVRLSEKRFEKRKGWKSYKARTSMLLPLPPKEEG